MLQRRSFMAMLGLAPVAGAVGVEAQPMPSGVSIVNPLDAVSNVEWAKRRVDAIRWARQNAMPVGDEHFLGSPADVIDDEVLAMKSWSTQHKQRAMRERRLRRYRENYLSDALARVEKEVKLSLAPEWVRRFLS